MTLVTTRALPPTAFSSPTDQKTPTHLVVEKATDGNSMEEFAARVRTSFETPLLRDRLLAFSSQLQQECKERMLRSDISMLPSYQHTLPTGQETGDFLALDMGGTTFRVAIIRLSGKRDGGDGLEVIRIRNFAISRIVRDMQGQIFFDWMAEKIREMLVEYNHITGATNAHLNMGLAWSFPIEQTSPRSGRLLSMGKGFRATHGVEGQDLSQLIMRSCSALELNVEMRAIVNDGAATLMTQAYRDPTTRMSLILGTGTNTAVFLPVSALGPGKFGDRPNSWLAVAKHVLVNTELSMVGKHILPTTPWDEELNANHILPDFQPLEYLVAGRYLGEIARLILVDAIETAGLFSGQTPSQLDEPYAFDTSILAAFENDSSYDLLRAKAAFLKAHPTPISPTRNDLQFIQDLAKLVSRRAAAYLASALHALWTLRTTSEGLLPGEATHVTIACDGTLVGKYPGFRDCCQGFLDDLCATSGAARGAVTLEMAPESSIFGAAVAVACLEDIG